MPTIGDIKQEANHSVLVRKVLQAVGFIAPYSADPVDSLIGSDGQLKEIPADYKSVGMVTKDDGFTFSFDTDSEDVEALGYSSPVRTDITGQTKTVNLKALETKRTTLELAYGIDLSAVEPSADGEVMFDLPELVGQRFYRLLIIGADGDADDAWFLGKFYPRLSITEVGDMQWVSSDALSYDITGTAYTDTALGTPQREFIAGPAAVANADILGFGTPAAG